MRHTLRHKRRLNSGYAAVMAMLFLVIISVMAAGLYSTVISSVTVAQSERASSEAMAAAESGMEIARWKIQQLKMTSTSQTQLMSDVAAALGTQAKANYFEHPDVALHGGAQYKFQLKDANKNASAAGFNKLLLTVFGSAGNRQRAIQVELDVTGVGKPLKKFSAAAGMVSGGKINVVDGQVDIREEDGTFSNRVFSVKNLTDVSVHEGATPYQGGDYPEPPDLPTPPTEPKKTRAKDPKAWATYDRLLEEYHAKMATYEQDVNDYYENDLHVHAYGNDPVFPTIPTNFYTALEAKYAEQQAYLQNKKPSDPDIPAKDRITLVTSGSYKVNGGATIEGILYLKKGVSQLDILGGATVKGVIIVEPDLTRNMPVTIQSGSVELSTSPPAPQFLIDQGYEDFMFIAPTADFLFKANINRGSSQETGIMYMNSLTMQNPHSQINLKGAIICHGDINIGASNGGSAGVAIVLPPDTAGGGGGVIGPVTDQELEVDDKTYCELNLWAQD